MRDSRIAMPEFQILIAGSSKKNRKAITLEVGGAGPIYCFSLLTAHYYFVYNGAERFVAHDEQ
jgi:hypothetical protein